MSKILPDIFDARTHFPSRQCRLAKLPEKFPGRCAKKRIMSDFNIQMPVRSIKVNIKDIGYIRWCLESHDGIANPTTRMETPEILDLTIAPHFLEDAENLIDALIKELGIERVQSPDTSPLL